MVKKQKSPKIALLHLVQNLGVGGAEILLLQYIKALGNEKYEHFVYSIGPEGPMKQKLETLGIHLTIGPLRRSIRHPIKFMIDLSNIVRALFKYIKKHQIQIIQSHLSEANQLGVLVGKLTRVPTFPTIHNTNVFDYDSKKFSLKSKLHQWVDRFTYRFADRIVAVSDEVKGIALNALQLDESRILVIRNGILYYDEPRAPINFQKEIGAIQGDVIIIGVGSLTYQKAFEVLIKASHEILKRGFHEFRVIIIGKGREEPRLKNLIKRYHLNSYVKLLGYKENVIEYLQSSDIFVMPSRYEGLSIAMIEAMACGLPIVASNAPGLKTYIKDQRNGLLFVTEDHDDLAKKILSLVQEKDLRGLLSQSARNTFHQFFDMRENILPLKNLIRSFTV